MAMQTLEMRRANQTTAALQNESQAAESARRDMFALVAHEIRSPIATMISLARTVTEGIFGPLSDPRYAEFLVDLKDTAEHVGQITDRMLDFVRLGSGEIDLKDDAIRISSLFESARRIVAGFADSKGVIIDVHPVDESLMIRVDQTLTIQMLTNLLHNAIKFSPAGDRVIFGHCGYFR